MKSVKTVHQDVKKDDLIVMATDGVLDNVFDEEMIRIIEQVFSTHQSNQEQISADLIGKRA